MPLNSLAGSVKVASYVPPSTTGSSFASATPPFSLPPPPVAAPHGTPVGLARGLNVTTQGFPHPTSIEEQKQAFTRSLDLQLEEGNNSLLEQNKERKQQLYQAAESRKAALIAQVEQQMKIQEMALDEQTNQAMMGLKKAALDQRAHLEQQAATMTMEYQQRKMQEDFAASQAEMQRQYQESHTKLQSEVQRQLIESQQRIQSEAQKLTQDLKDRGVPMPAAKYAVATPVPRQSFVTIATPPYGRTEYASPIRRREVSPIRTRKLTSVQLPL